MDANAVIAAEKFHFGNAIMFSFKLALFLNIFLANILLHYLYLRGKISPKEIILLKEPVNMIRTGTYQNIFLQVTYDFSYDCCRQKTVI